MIVTEKLGKAYGSALVVDDVSLTFPSQGITAIIGANGAGKSTLLVLISRLIGMDSGNVYVDGLDISKTPSDVLARRLSILRQDNYMNARLSVHDLVAFGRYPYSKGRLTLEDKTHIDQALAYLNLTDIKDRFIDELSGGQRQRAFVAMVLCQDTDYVLLDEPLNNLDMAHARTMMKILRRAAGELGKTIVVVLHDINFAACYADYIVAMRAGQICCTGTPDEIMTSQALKKIYGIDIAVHQIGKNKIGFYYT